MNSCVYYVEVDSREQRILLAKVPDQSAGSRDKEAGQTNLMVEGEDADDVISYILSHKGKDAASLR
ncbi:MAG: hypothetical protein ACXW3Z_17550 [Limisphaerales bacterium]